MATPVPPHPLLNVDEQRILTLFLPFRNACLSKFTSAERSSSSRRAINLESKLMVLAQNITFLAHNHVANTARIIAPTDIFLATRGSTGSGVEPAGGAVAVLVRYKDEIIAVVKATFEEGGSVIDALRESVDGMLSESF